MQILVGTDLSSRSEAAVMRALQLRREPGDRVTLVHVVDGDQPDEIIELLRERAMGWLRSRLPARTESAGVDLFVRVGDPYSELLEASDECAADLIVLGAQRGRLLLDSFIGTTAERLLRMSARPVLVVHRTEPRPYRTALAAINPADASVQALSAAQRLDLLPSQSQVVYVFPVPAMGKMREVGVDPAPHVEAARAEAEQALADRLKEAGFRSLVGRTLLSEGRPSSTIRDLVAEIEPDLLILGTRGLRGLKRALVGSVTETLLRTVACDVLAVPTVAGK